MVKDHCHLTGKFRRLAHNICNLNTRKAHSSFIPILFHNFSGYDSYLVKMAVEKGIEIKDIVGKSSEKYKSGKKGCLQFWDSYRLLDASLDKLSTALTYFPSVDANRMEYEQFKKKLAYPYEKGKTIESFFELLKLGREDYFSTLTKSYPDFEEMIRTQATVAKNQLTNLKELTRLHLKNDVLLQTDSFRDYIVTCKPA